MAALTKTQRALLDLRYVAYNPDETYEGSDSPVPLVCPLHGAYSVPYSDLLKRSHKKWLTAPSCPECDRLRGLYPAPSEERKRLSLENDYRMTVSLIMSARSNNTGGPGRVVWGSIDWEPMSHWHAPDMWAGHFT